MNTKTKAWVNMGLFLLTLLINTLGAYGFINGSSQKEVSDTYQTLITPSPATFSIWGVIYTLLLICPPFGRSSAKASGSPRLSWPGSRGRDGRAPPPSAH